MLKKQTATAEEKSCNTNEEEQRDVIGVQQREEQGGRGNR